MRGRVLGELAPEKHTTPSQMSVHRALDFWLLESPAQPYLATVDVDRTLATMGDEAIGKEEQEETYEQKYVHDIYNKIASHFSQTRYKVRRETQPSP